MQKAILEFDEGSRDNVEFVAEVSEFDEDFHDRMRPVHLRSLYIFSIDSTVNIGSQMVQRKLNVKIYLKVNDCIFYVHMMIL